MSSSEGSQAIAAAKQRLAAAEAQRMSALKTIGTANALAESARKMNTTAESMAATAMKNKREATSMLIAANEMAKTATKTNCEADSMKKSAHDMADTAKKHKDEAQTLFDSSSKEAQDAEEDLKAMEKKYEVIDVDADDEELPRMNENASKKRKALSSITSDGSAPALARVPNNENSSAAANSTTRERELRTAMFRAAVARRSEEVARRSEEPMGFQERCIVRENVAAGQVNKILVRGGGCPEVIGTLERDLGLGTSASGTAIFTREGQWKNRPVKFTLFYERNNWYIGTWADGKVNCTLPPSDGNEDGEEIIIDDDSEDGEEDNDDDDYCVGNGLGKDGSNSSADQTEQPSSNSMDRRSSSANSGKFCAGRIEKLYRTISSSDAAELPPMNASWMTIGDGVSPAPRLNY